MDRNCNRPRSSVARSTLRRSAVFSQLSWMSLTRGQMPPRSSPGAKKKRVDFFAKALERIEVIEVWKKFLTWIDFSSALGAFVIHPVQLSSLGSGSLKEKCGAKFSNPKGPKSLIVPISLATHFPIQAEPSSPCNAEIEDKQLACHGPPLSPTVADGW